MHVPFSSMDVAVRSCWLTYVAQFNSLNPLLYLNFTSLSRLDERIDIKSWGVFQQPAAVYLEERNGRITPLYVTYVIYG